jgi:hypothetical protein
MMVSITALYRIADPDDRRANKTAVTDQSSIVIAANIGVTAAASQRHGAGVSPGAARGLLYRTRALVIASYYPLIGTRTVAGTGFEPERFSLARPGLVTIITVDSVAQSL